MTPLALTDKVNTIICGDVLPMLQTLPSESVNCCVTSPPYWGLRDYGTASWVGGDEKCDHIPDRARNRALNPTSQITGKGHQLASAVADCVSNVCRKCGAVRVDQQLGLERTPEEYVARMVEIFREVKRVLRKDGTLWLNLGDSYVGANNTDRGGNANFGSQAGVSNASQIKGAWTGLSPKNLVGIPWRVAFALQADGWYLRSDIIWSKPNPMPESVTDRPTKAHEYIFLLSKSQKYYYDAESIAEDSVTYEGRPHGVVRDRELGYDSKQDKIRVTLGQKSFSRGQARGAGVEPSGNGNAEFYEVPTKRNKRSVWTVNSEPYPEAHFATFPQKLIEPCIKAGCPEDGVVLDPFFGSGTTGLVARKLNRNYIGIELNPVYVKLAENRIAKEIGLFA